ncbi:hypothetical protein FFT09_22665 [Saccharomonospora piscinae]|uniref:hypothetical protein n=1 Tax=Saccharomonospora piscinae TaxID=687388 RepID=UPI00110727FF|nr:hypothetical protein [Saccharomonospora piscinae]TLW89233.1 hypothetical protein FFT09_22665 [Saccharomonospora piscinae]
MVDALLPRYLFDGELEDIITTAQHVPSEKTVQALREQLNQDTQILASLDPNSDAYERLAARIERQTGELLDYEEQRERQRRAARVAQAELAERQRQADATAHRPVGFVIAVIGGAVIYTGWGTWWLLLGIVLCVFGLIALFTKEI